MTAKLFTEPLTYFLVLCFGMFGLSAWVDDDLSNYSKNEIFIEQNRVADLTQAFTNTWHRAPDEAELAALVREEALEEIMYREALALGLEQEDAIVRRRLRQKFERFFQGVIDSRGPSDEELSSYLKDHPKAFREEARISFRQVYLDPVKRSQTLDADAKALLSELNGDAEEVDPAMLGDRSLLPDNFRMATELEIDNNFGKQFTAALVKGNKGRWFGPVRSGYGEHLVFIDRRVEPTTPPLSKVRAEVEREWRVEHQAQASEALYEKLREKYTLIIEDLDLASTPEGT